MRILILTLLLLFEIILESTVLSFISIGGVTLNLVLITIVSIGLIYGKIEGMSLGLISGLLCDILFGRVLGFHALSYMLIGYLMGIISELVYRENRLISPLFTALSIFIYHVSFYFLQYFSGIEFSILQYFKNITVVSILVNSVIAFFIYPIFLKLSQQAFFR
ncbi:rod shape-determining protein MreD [Garciella nitratireducens]|uniref:Rod shape-determining protein MreD n=1 Tax=Garciella nitratireducens DSM 15102 TaxID=1121911 RepID=A0A1T4K9C8_9FIRM|nr:rod shape-determining protein MreD [Garciella nitratireducens]SJZ39019.1 rod shape-determining protein MreD [Garciella nitratireducens DSM 15102]